MSQPKEQASNEYAGVSPPLDLKAVEANLAKGETHLWQAEQMLALLRETRAALKLTQEALVWASGSEDFNFGGKARWGWVATVQPTLDHAAAVLAKATEGQP